MLIVHITYRASPSHNIRFCSCQCFFLVPRQSSHHVFGSSIFVSGSSFLVSGSSVSGFALFFPFFLFSGGFCVVFQVFSTLDSMTMREREREREIQPQRTELVRSLETLLVEGSSIPVTLVSVLVFRASRERYRRNARRRFYSQVARRNGSKG